MAGMRMRDRVHPYFSSKQTFDFPGDHQSEKISIACYALAREVTQYLQRIRKQLVADASIEEQVAVLHILAQFQGSLRTVEESVGGDQDMELSPRSRTLDSDSGPIPSVGDAIQQAEENFSSRIDIAQIDSVWEHTIKVKLLGYEPDTTRDVVITQSKLLDWINKALSRFPNSSAEVLRCEDFHHIIAANGQSVALPTAISAQCAGTWDTWVIEAGYKGIEILFGAGIVIGSTGGAWLALTLSSIFPQRVAAGLYVTSFGQSISNRGENMLSSNIFIPPGTSWVEGGNGYCVRPCLRWPWFDDATRNLLGYMAQFVVMYLLTWYKLTIRNVAFSEAYSQTVDAVRYVVLVILPVILLICLSWLERPFDWRRRFLLSSYLILWAVAIICVIFGQGKLDRVWGIHFTQIPRLVNPIASIGAVVAIYLGANPGDPRLQRETWGLIWAIGTCTALW